MSDIADKLKDANQPNKELVIGHRADKGFTPEEDFSPSPGLINNSSDNALGKKEEGVEEEDPIPGADNLW